MDSLRATLSLHEWNDKSKHLDLFLEKEESLLAFEISYTELNSFLNGDLVFIKQKTDHRKMYLDYSGEVTSNRGTITILWQGFWDGKEIEKPMFAQKTQSTISLHL